MKLTGNKQSKILKVYLSLKRVLSLVKNRYRKSTVAALWWFELAGGRAWHIGEGPIMPIATGVSDDRKMIKLKSLPEGYVVIRRLTWGEKLHRKSFMDKVKVNSDGASNRSKASNFSTEINMMNEEVTKFEFTTCIVEHNLEYNAGTEEVPDIRLLDFRIPAHIKMLDGNVGEEINDAIEEYNNFEAEEETGK